jgi:MFS superfamily sulfate permease-like transporter
MELQLVVTITASDFTINFIENPRELIAQGIGNIASGMIGGLPVTQEAFYKQFTYRCKNN